MISYDDILTEIHMSVSTMLNYNFQLDNSQEQPSMDRPPKWIRIYTNKLQLFSQIWSHKNRYRSIFSQNFPFLFLAQ